MLDPISDSSHTGVLAARLLVTVGGYVAAFWACWLAARRVDPAPRPAVRLLTTLLIAGWLQLAGFMVLAPLTLFRFWIVAPLGVGLGIAAHRLLDGAGARAELGTLWGALRDGLAESATGWVRIIGVGALVHAAYRIIRGLALPFGAWDTLTYHLLKAGRWVQSGGLAIERAPDAWGYYEYYPWGGDIIWAWCMLPTRSDAFVALGGALVGAIIVLGGAVLARELGATRRRALVAGAVLYLTPTVANSLCVAYVDNTVLAFFVGGAALLVRAWTTRPALAIVAAGALASAAAAKTSMLPVAGVAGPVLLWAALKSERHRALAVAGVLLAVLVALPAPLRGLMDHGSPTYPFPLTLGGSALFAGNPEMTALFNGDFYTADQVLSESQLPGFIFWTLPYPNWHFLNLGVGAMLFVLLGLVGLARTLRDGPRAPVLYLGLVILVTVFGLLSPGMRAQRIYYAPVVARFLTPALAILLAAAVTLPGKAVDRVIQLGAFVQLLFCIPRGHGTWDVFASIAALVVVLATGGIGVIAWRRRDELTPATAAVLGGMALLFAWYGTETVRREFRAPVYEAYCDFFDPSYDLHPLPPEGLQYRIWEALDGDEGRRIAYAAGWGMNGHNWFRYPLLGTRLQNEVLYVPPTGDGQIIDYWDAAQLAEHADATAWLGRLAALEVDTLVFGPPPPPEIGWVRALPGVFEPLEVGPFGAAWTIDRDALVAALERPVGPFGVPADAWQEPIWSGVGPGPVKAPPSPEAHP